MYRTVTNLIAFLGRHAIRQSAERDAHLRQFLLAHEFVGGEDDGGLLLFLGKLSDVVTHAVSGLIGTEVDKLRTGIVALYLAFPLQDVCVGGNEGR